MSHKKSPEALMCRRLVIMTTKERGAAYEQAAKLAGHYGFSEWIRQVLDREADKLIEAAKKKK